MSKLLAKHESQGQRPDTHIKGIFAAFPPCLNLPVVISKKFEPRMSSFVIRPECLLITFLFGVLAMDFNSDKYFIVGTPDICRIQRALAHYRSAQFVLEVSWLVAQLFFANIEKILLL